MGAHKSGGIVRTHPSRGMAEYLSGEGMLSDEQARDLRQQGYLDQDMADQAPQHQINQAQDRAIQISIRPLPAAQPDDSHDKSQPSQNDTEPVAISTSNMTVTPTTSLEKPSSEHDSSGSNVLCCSAAQDDSTMPAWSPTAFSEQHHAEVADLFALRAAVWHMTRRATDLSNATNLQSIDIGTLSLPPLSLSPSIANNEVDLDTLMNVPQTATLQRRKSWTGPSDRDEQPDALIRPSSTPPNSSHQWLEEGEYIAYAQGSGSGDGSRRTTGTHLCSLSSNARTIGNARRRAADDEDEGNADRDQDGRGKRRRLDESVHKPSARIRLPCIFNMGEPDAFPKHTATYEHISELLRHLTTHDFYACQKCFTRFNNTAEILDHICKKTCENTACRRTVLLNTAQPFDCDCVTTAVEQWEQLFSLQYPGQHVPALRPNTYDDPSMTPSLQPRTPFLLSVPQSAVPAFDNNVLDTPNTNLWAHEAFDLSMTQVHAPRTVLPAMRTNLGHAFQKEYQQLSERLAQLERRKDDASSKREEARGTLLLSLWEALCETGSPKARIDGPLWRMMQRDAPEVLRQSMVATTLTSGSSSVLHSQLLQNGVVGQHFERHHTSTNGNFGTNGNSDWMMNLTATGDFSNASAQPNAGYEGM
ncbi:unnamed protein product [Cercospora beticola]|nr:unnamed protein product [Cercospora beticola]